MPRYFIGVVHLKQVEAARRGGFVAFSHGRRSAVETLDPGDRVIYYAPKSDFDGDPVQAFVAHAEITGDGAEERQFPGTGFTAATRAARYDGVTRTPVRPLLEDLSFVKNPKYWGMAFRNGKFEIGSEDYARISGAFLGGAT